jgi:glutamine amidotransferase
MCRLLGIIPSRDASELQQALSGFRLQAHTGIVPAGIEKGHRDGWGLFAYTQHVLGMAVKHPEDAAEDPRYAAAVEGIAGKKPELVIGHLRKASQGARRLANTHPFAWNGVTFCHNGTIKNPEDILLTRDYEARCRGETDSERFFMFIMQCAKGDTSGEAIRKGIAEALRVARSSLDFTALNMLISNGEYLWAVREIHESDAVIQTQTHLAAYYSLMLGADSAQTCTIVASEPITLPVITWQPLQNHCMVELGQHHHVDVSRF